LHWHSDDEGDRVGDEIVSPIGLKLSQGVRKIWRLALTQNQEARCQRFRLYVIEVGGSDKYEFYVGQTGLTVETRFEQHQSRDKDMKSAKIFCKRYGTPLRLRRDLFEGLPYFTERKTAITAEGVLADVIQTQLKARVNCDALSTRQRRRASAVSLKKKIVKKASPKSVS
jgi:hypothetical protein